LIQVYNRRDPITSTAIVLAGRLATTVRKQFILAIPKGKDKVDFLALDWWKA
jgi:tRNA-intron endonuclease